jgi:HD superfamily phosphodiesterase
MNREQIIRKIEQFSKQKMWFIPAHDYEHADRTRNRAIKIAKWEWYNHLLNVEIAALLHDIWFSTDKQAKWHGKRWSQITHKFLSELALDEKSINEICYAIQHHDSNHNWEGKLLEILRDADRMELFGTIGISRALQSIPNHTLFNYNYPKWETWEYGSKDFDHRFAEWKGKWITVVDQLNFQVSCFDDMHTETWKKLAKSLVEIIKDFIKWIEKEYQNSLINI